jgi:hypothetical protein
MLIHIIAFYRWAFANGYKEGLHLDRIDNDLGYSSKNCRFGEGLVSENGADATS